MTSGTSEEAGLDVKLEFPGGIAVVALQEQDPVMFLTSFSTFLIGKRKSPSCQELGGRWMNGQTFRRRRLGEMAWAFKPLPMHPAYWPVPRGIGDEGGDVQFRWSPLALVPVLLW